MNGAARATVMVIFPKVLVNVPDDLEGCFWQVESGHEALEIMRMFSVDLLLVNMHLPDIDTWEFVQRVKILRPGAKWVLLCRNPKAEQELRARTLGVLRIFYTMPDATELYELAVSIRERAKVVVVG